ncbi:DUF5919 domain-containing protein [Actinophytocola sp.]|uniref:DUF5919 domain-containing protein n=1 Tax=Actinophytocola sp. TaxID=1872138 RepID=UPI00389ABDDB
MANGRVRRSLIRFISDENLDLYLLGTVALVFTVLGITGISDVRTTSAVVVALLALLAFSQIRSRKLVEQIRNSSRGGLAAVFTREFPAALVSRRAAAKDLLLVGLAMSRTVHGIRSDLSRILAAGGRVRVLVLDPTDRSLLEAADRRNLANVGPDKLRARILTTLDDLTSLREHIDGRLEIRVSSDIPPAGFNCVDAESQRGLVTVQHYEYRPAGEAAPIFVLTPADGAWYQHFLAEAERLWAAGAEWPLSLEARAARAPRPVFLDEFGPELDEAVAGATDLLVTGVARNIFVNNHYRRLEKKLQSGHRVRVLLADPAGPAIDMAAARYFPVRTPEGFRERIEHTLRLLAELKSSTGGDLEVRLTTHLISVLQVVTDSALFAEYYVYRDLAKPKFVLTAGDPAYRDFRTEAEKLWDSATPVSGDHAGVPQPALPPRETQPDGAQG